MLSRVLLILFATAALAALPASRVLTVEQDGYRTIQTNAIPDHAPGEFPRRGNPNAIRPQDFTFRCTLSPRVADRATPSRFAFFGVAINGVPFEPGTAEFWQGDRTWRYEAIGGLDLGLDEHLAHVQPEGTYHYHGLPHGLIERLGGEGKKMLLLGYAADGFPIYSEYGYADAANPRSELRKLRSSWRLKTGTRSGGPGGAYDGKFTSDFEFVNGFGDLDESNGRTGPTPEYPEGIYHYHITSTFPFIGRAWRGEPDASFEKRRPPGAPFPGFAPER